MIRHATVEAMGSFFDTYFEPMEIPQQTDGLAVSCHRGMDVTMAVVVWSDSKCLLTTSTPNGKARTLPITAENRDRLRKLVRADELARLGAVFVDDILDGDSYLVKQAHSGGIAKSYLGNPRLTGLRNLESLADGLDSFLSMALSMTRRVKA